MSLRPRYVGFLCAAGAVLIVLSGASSATSTPLEPIDDSSYQPALFALLKTGANELPPDEAALAAAATPTAQTILQDLAAARQDAGTTPPAGAEAAALTTIGVPVSDTQRYYWFAGPGVYWPVGPIPFNPPPIGSGIDSATFYYAGSPDWTYKGGPHLGPGWTLQFVACGLADGGWVRPP